MLNKAKKLLTQYETEYLAKLDLFVIDLDKISNIFDSEKLFKLLSELNELSKTNNFKTFVLFTTENNLLISKVYSNFTPEQKQQILFLKVNDVNKRRGYHKNKSMTIRHTFVFFAEK